MQKPALGLVEFVALMATMTSLVALSIDAGCLRDSNWRVTTGRRGASNPLNRYRVLFRHGTGSNVLWAFSITAAAA